MKLNFSSTAKSYSGDSRVLCSLVTPPAAAYSPAHTSSTCVHYLCTKKKTCKVLSQVLTLSQARDTSDKGPFYDITRSRSWNISRIEQGREKIGFPPLRAGSRQMQSSAF